MNEVDVDPSPTPVAGQRHLTAVPSASPAPLRFRWDAGRDHFGAVEAIAA